MSFPFTKTGGQSESAPGAVCTSPTFPSLSYFAQATLTGLPSATQSPSRSTCTTSQRI